MMAKTKKALVLSVLSTLLCLVMLIGVTLAWFTDTASTAVKKVQAGNLDVQLVYADGTEIISPLSFIKADGGDVLWEPGCTYNLPAVYVKNNGNLALKYKFVITGIDGDAKLLEVIDWTIKVGDLVTDLNSFEGQLGAGLMSSEGLVLSGHMQETAGNEYQGLSLGGFSITVIATQDTVEADSFGNQYDKDAVYPVFVADQQELNAAITNATGNTKIVLPAGDFQLETGTAKNKNITISGTQDTELLVIDPNNTNPSEPQVSYQDGATLTFEGITILGQASGNFAGMARVNKTTFVNCLLKGKLTLYGDATFIGCTLENDTDYSIWTWGAKNVEFTNCTFNSGGKALLLYGHGPTHLIVNGCTFNDSGSLGSVGKAAIETGNDYGATYSLTVNSTTVNGFEINPNGINTGTALWANKNSMDQAHLNVVVDGEDVY
jgi:predicted ribosomally synthesized peptide with SipW-like signal peptide